MCARACIPVCVSGTFPPNRYAFPITVTGYSTSADGSVSEVQAEADLEFAKGSSGRKPPKGVLNWVGQPQPGQDPEQAEVCCGVCVCVCVSRRTVCWILWRLIDSGCYVCMFVS